MSRRTRRLQLGSAVAWLVSASLAGALAACTDPTFAGDDAGHAEASAEAVDSGDSSDSDAGTSEAVRDADACPSDGCDHGEPDAGDASASGEHDAAKLDASTADSSASDDASPPGEAGPVVANPEGGLDAVRAGWVGHYAARSWVFSFDNADVISVQTLGSYLTLVDITPNPDGGLTLREEVCRFESGFQAAGISVHVRIDYPLGVSLTTPLSYDAQRFWTQTASAYVGYEAAPAGCTPGATAMAGGPVRPWLTNNMCDCPTTTAPPISARDCRVIDSDRDSQPGTTFTITTGGSTGIYNVAQEQPLALVNGYREGERLYAQRQYGDKTKVLSCTIDGTPTAVSRCALGTAGACLPSYNPVEMLRIQPQQGCDDIRQRELAWFERAQPAFPTGCVAPGQHY